MQLEIHSKVLYQMGISALRYAIRRNNHLEPCATIENLKDTLTAMGNQNQWARALAEQSIDEVDWESKWVAPNNSSYIQENNEHALAEFIEWCKNFLK